MPREHSIYVIMSIETSEIAYVGVSINWWARIGQHLSYDSKVFNWTERNNWIVVIAEKISTGEREALIAEAKWINRLEPTINTRNFVAERWDTGEIGGEDGERAGLPIIGYARIYGTENDDPEYDYKAAFMSALRLSMETKGERPAGIVPKVQELFMECKD